MPRFHVSVLRTDDSESTWEIPALDLEDALNRAIQTSGGASGIYSVWDPDDPMGMPLLERDVA
jgi:hypothetical protein